MKANEDSGISRIFLGDIQIEKMYVGDRILYDRKTCSRPQKFIGASWKRLFNFIKKGE